MFLANLLSGTTKQTFQKNNVANRMIHTNNDVTIGDCVCENLSNIKNSYIRPLSGPLSGPNSFRSRPYCFKPGPNCLRSRPNSIRSGNNGIRLKLGTDLIFLGPDLF